MDWNTIIVINSVVVTPKADGSIVDSLGNGNTLTTTGGTLYGASGGPGLPWWPA